MKNKIPCEVIQDLFPSYIDGLTSEVTNQMVDEHVGECEGCKNVLSAMKEPETKQADNEHKEQAQQEKAEIDFLKKTRKRITGVVLGSLLGAILLMVAVLGIRTYFIPRPVDVEMLGWDVEVTGNELELGIRTRKDIGLMTPQYEMEGGIVKIFVDCVKQSDFHEKVVIREKIVIDEDIAQIWINDRIIWSNGGAISALTSEVYQTRHAYVGDAPANGRSMNILDMEMYLGDYTVELQTATEPYGLKVVFEHEKSLGGKLLLEDMMKDYAYMLLAIIENLGEVSYEYEMAGEACVFTVDVEEASAFAGRDIKECGKEVLWLQELVDLTRVNTYLETDREIMQLLSEETLDVCISNYTDKEIASLRLAYYVGDELYGSMGVMNADESLIQLGDTVVFAFEATDFEDKKWENVEVFKAELSFCDENGIEHKVDEMFWIEKYIWALYDLRLTGNEEDGYLLQYN